MRARGGAALRPLLRPLCTRSAPPVRPLCTRSTPPWCPCGTLSAPSAHHASSLQVVVANTLPMPPNVLKTTRKVRQLSVGKLLAQVITCIHTGDSVSGMFDVKKAGVLLA